jgi:hypothetical protein
MASHLVKKDKQTKLVNKKGGIATFINYFLDNQAEPVFSLTI